MRMVWSLGAALVFALFGAALWLAAPALGQRDDEGERSRFVAFVEGQLSAPGRQIRITGLDGALSSNATVERITIADDEGVWLTLENAEIVWTRSALLRGVLDVESLTAQRLDWPRGPVSADAPARIQSRQLALPELPVEVSIDALSLARASLGEPLFGLAAELQIVGALDLSEEALAIDFDVARLDGPGGSLNFAARYEDGAELALQALVQEPANGVLANLLNIQGRPPLQVRVDGNGALDDLNVDASLDADQVRILDGQFNLAAAQGGRTFQASASGPVSNLIAPAYRAFFGQSMNLQAQGFVPADGGVLVRNFDLQSGELSASGSAQTASDGFLTGLLLDIALGADDSGGLVRLPIASAPSTVEAGTLAVRFGTLSDQPNNWTVRGRIDRLRSGQVSAQTITLDFAGNASDLDDQQARQLTFAGNMIARDIAADNGDLARAIGPNLVVAVDGAWQAGNPVAIDALRLDGATLDALAQGEIDGTTLRGRADVQAQRLAAFAPLAGRPLTGALAVDVDGFFNLLTGAFDAQVDGAVTNLGFGVDAADTMLTGTTTLNGALARGEDGVQARDLVLTNNQFDARLNGMLGAQGSDLTANVVIEDLATLGQTASGRAVLDARLQGSGDQGSQEENETLRATFTLGVPDGQLGGQTLRNAQVSLDGVIVEDAFRGSLNGAGQVAGELLSLAVQTIAINPGAQRFDGLSVDAPGAQLIGSLVRNGDTGIVDGDLSLAASNVRTLASLALLQASGALDAQLVLSGQNGQQSVAAQGQASHLQVSDASARSATFDITVNDALGAADIRGVISASDISAANVSVGQLQTSVSPGGQFQVTASSLSVPELANAGVAPLRVDASGQINNGVLTLVSARATDGAGIDLAAQGRVPFSGNGLDVRLAGQAPLSLASRFIDRPALTFAGSVVLDAAVSRSLSNPLVTGQVSTSGASVSDGLSGVRLTNMGVNASLDGQSINLTQAQANVVGGGTISAGGRVDLVDGFSSDLAIVLRELRYTDGRLVTVTLDGDLQLTGPLTRAPTLSGSVNIDRADIQIPSSLSSAAGFIDVEHRNASDRIAQTFQRARPAAGSSRGAAPGVGLNVQINAPNEIYVRGRGVDAELGGSILLGGTTNTVSPSGAFSLIRGRIDILQQRFTLSEGSVTLVGDLDPFLSVTARTQSDDIEVAVVLSGRISEPVVTLSSRPTLPQDEVLARLIFNRGLTELSPLQIAQLALAAAELAGETSGSAIGSLRDTLGLSDLDVVVDETGSPAVRAGQYVQENVYLGVEASASGEARTTINLDVTDDITLRGEAGTNGDSAVGIFFERDY